MTNNIVNFIVLGMLFAKQEKQAYHNHLENYPGANLAETL